MVFCFENCSEKKFCYLHKSQIYPKSISVNGLKQTAESIIEEAEEEFVSETVASYMVYGGA